MQEKLLTILTFGGLIGINFYFILLAISLLVELFM